MLHAMLHPYHVNEHLKSGRGSYSSLYVQMECAIIEMVLFHIPDKDIVCVTV